MIPPALEQQWFRNALAWYALEIVPLHYCESEETFDRDLPEYVVLTLATKMYCYYLTKELSRVLKLNGIVGKDLSITGMGDTKRVTKEELESELAIASDLINRQKVQCFGGA